MGKYKIVVPASGKNWCKNPTQADDDGFQWTSSGTLASEYSTVYWGNACKSGTYTASTSIMRLNPQTLPTNASGIASAYVYVPTSYNLNGAYLYVYFSLFTGGTHTAKVTYTAADQGKWKRIYSTWTTASDGTGEVQVRLSAAPTTCKVYVDGFQIEETTASVPSTFMDGSFDDHFWDGEWSGTVTRRGESRLYGDIVDLEDTYGLYFTQSSGTGMPPVENLSVERSLADGQEHQRTRFKANQLLLIPKLLGTSESDLHAKRKALIQDLGPVFHNGDPVKFIYDNGDGRPREIVARYNRGLEFNKRSQDGFSEMLGFEFIADTPYWYDEGNEAEWLEVNNKIDQNVMIRRNHDGTWTDLGTLSTGSGETYTYGICMGETRDYIYLGGNFTNFNGISGANYAVRFNKYTETYEKISGGAAEFNNVVEDILVMPDQDTIFFCGYFTDADGITAADYIVKFVESTTTWSALGTFSSGATVTGILCMALDTQNNLWVGGEFTNGAGIANADYIARWDITGSTWYALGTGGDGGETFNDVRAIAVDPKTGDVYAGGYFGGMGGVAETARIARWSWDDSAWHTVGGGSAHGNDANGVFALYFDEDGLLYVGGLYQQIGNWGGSTAYGLSDANNITVWTGSQYIKLGGGVNGAVNDIAKYKDFILIGGSFTAAGGLLTTNKFTLWNGTAFVNPDCDFAGGIYYQALWSANSDELFLAGSYETSWKVSTPGTRLITYTGTAPTYPKLVSEWYTGTGTGSFWLQYLGHMPSGANIWFNYIMTRLEDLEVNFDPENRYMKSSHWGDRWAILPTSNVNQFRLWPGTNRINFLLVSTISGGTTSLHSLLWRTAYTGID